MSELICPMCKSDKVITYDVTLREAISMTELAPQRIHRCLSCDYMWPVPLEQPGGRDDDVPKLN